jgi:CRP/FNR family transcriptional regulator
MVQSTIRIQKGNRLFEAGQSANKLYLVRTGSFKSILGSPDGRQQIIGFHFPGEILGLESFATRAYSNDAVALEDCESSAIDMSALEACARELPGLQHQIHCLIGNCLEAAQRTQFALGSMHAAERLAYFLLDLSDRFKARGLSGDALNLSMSREELGSFLGLKLETISRLMTHFDEMGLLQVHLRHVQIIDRVRLSRLLNHAGDPTSLGPMHKSKSVPSS